MTFNKKYKTLFLDVNTPVMEVDEKVNVILSPSMYWVKKLTILVKSVRDVKKLLPSIFEDTLADGNYNYTAYKNTNDNSEESEYFVFAYEDKKIIDILAEKNISMNNVASIRFAQSEFDTLDGAYEIDKEKCLFVKDGVVVLLPSVFIDRVEPLDMSSITLSKHKIVLQQFGHIVDNKSLYKIASVLMILMLFIIGEYFVTKHRTKQITMQKDELFTKYNLKSTMFQNKSMLKKYEAINKKQTKLRKYISHILAVKLKNDEKIALLELKGKVLTANFSGVKKGNDTYIENKVKSILNKNVKLKKKYSKEILYLEISL